MRKAKHEVGNNRKRMDDSVGLEGVAVVAVVDL